MGGQRKHVLKNRVTNAINCKKLTVSMLYYRILAGKPKGKRSLRRSRWLILRWILLRIGTSGELL
jgi:hypothetical protein